MIIRGFCPLQKCERQRDKQWNSIGFPKAKSCTTVFYHKEAAQIKTVINPSTIFFFVSKQPGIDIRLNEEIESFLIHHCNIL